MRISLAVDDLARVRVATTLGPVTESLFALELLNRSHTGPVALWRQRVYRQLGPHADSCRALLRAFLPVPDLVSWLGETDETAERHMRAHGLDRHKVLDIVGEFCRVAVLPYWSVLHAYLQAERDFRGRSLTTGGVDHLLTTLSPQVRWRTPVLQLPGEPGEDIRLGGRGLTLVPSVFHLFRPATVLHTGQFADRPVLTYSAVTSSAAAAALLVPPDRSDQALESLLGRTRAAVLRSLSDACTTSGLAKRLKISAAGASQHAAVLRGAGLITTRRHRNAVLHALTPLGRALVLGTPPAAEDPQPRHSSFVA